jgi:WD40 repeat protein/serine/threonine protein kinase
MQSKPDYAPDRERQLDEIILAYLNDADAGRLPERSDWLAQYPEFASELEEFLANQDKLEQMAAPLRGGADTASRAKADTETLRVPDHPPLDHSLSSLGNYQLLSVIARGGMGVVFRARQKSPDRQVAIKMIHAARLASASDIQRFRNESETVASLDHPNIVPIYEVAESRAQETGSPVLYFSMKLMEGGSLAAAVVSGKLAATSREEQRRAAELLATISRAVHYAHQRGVLHRDLKPANILFDGNGRPHVGDFGLAKRVGVDPSLTESGAIIGTPSYMAPELASPALHASRAATATIATDVYGLGAILYFTVTGKGPFEGTSILETLDGVLRQEPAPPSRLRPILDRDLETICLKCLQKEPGKRYASAEDLASDLDRWRRSEPILARPVSQTERAWRWCRRNPSLAITGTAAVTALLLGVIASTVFAVRAFQASERAEERTRLAEARLAQNYLERGLSICSRDGDPGRGLHWMALALENCPENEAHLEFVIRMNLSAWGSQVPKLEAVLTKAGTMRAAALSPDGHFFITCQDKAAQLWDVSARQPIGPPLQHHGIVRSVTFSPDSKMVLTGSEDHTARLWEVLTGRPIDPPFEHHTPVLVVAFSPDGHTILTGGADRTAQVWNIDSRSHPIPPWFQESQVSAASFSPDGKTVFIACQDHSACLLEIASGKALEPHLPPLGGWITAVAFSSEGKMILAGADDHQAHILDAATLKPLVSPLRHEGALLSVGWSPNGRVALTGSSDFTARLWESATGRPLARLPHLGGANYAAFTPDGQTIWTAGGDPNGNLCEIRVWQYRTPTAAPYSSSEKGLLKGVAFSPDGKLYVTGSEDRFGRVWDTASKTAVTPPLQHSNLVDSVALHPSGKMVLTASKDKTVRLWDAASGQAIGQPMKHGDRIRSAVFSPDGNTILTACDDQKARFWSTATQQEIAPPLEFPHEVISVAFSPDGTKFATSRAHDYLTQIWDRECLKEIGSPIRHHKGWIWSMAFSPDGKKLVTGSLDYKTQQWEAATGRAIGEPLQHFSEVKGVSYSPDGRIILTGCQDGTAWLWDATTGKQLGPALHHPGPVSCVAFHPDGRSFATGSSDNAVRFWPLPCPMAGSAKRIRLWAQVITGMEMDDQGNFQVLNGAEWETRRQWFQELD